MKKYLQGAVNEALSRMYLMKDKIPGASNNIFFEPLSTLSSAKIDEQIKNAKQLFEDINSSNFTYKDLIADLQNIIYILGDYEGVLIAALNRQNDNDITINFIIRKICKEINYPLQSPVACCLSKAEDYYCIYTEFNLMSVPLLESEFLLHLPDIYHELCHPLLDVRNNPKVTKLQEGLSEFQRIVRQHFVKRILAEKRKTNPTDNEAIYFNWIKCWVYWSMELFCDLFAVYTLGTAFVWGHFHLCVKHATVPFDIPLYEESQHPADSARMEVLLMALKLLNKKADAEKIKNKWDEYLDINNFTSDSYYEKAFPKQILEQCVVIVFQAVKSIGCKTIDKYPPTNNSMGHILNNGWEKFRREPLSFSKWEKQEIHKLKEKAEKYNNPF